MIIWPVFYHGLQWQNHGKMILVLVLPVDPSWKKESFNMILWLSIVNFTFIRYLIDLGI